MKIDIEQFKRTFFEESEDHLGTLERELMKLASDAQDPEAMNCIFRAVHSIKGGSGTFGFTDVTSFTHSFESVLDAAREGRLVTNGPLVDLSLRAMDVLRGLLEAARTGSAVPPQMPEVLQALDALLHGDRPAAASSAAPVTANKSAEWRIRFRPAESIFRTGMDPALIAREFETLGKLKRVRVDTSRVPVLKDLDPLNCHLSWEFELEATTSAEALRDVFAFVEDGAEIQIESVGQHAPALAAALPSAVKARSSDATPAASHAGSQAASSIRVPVAKVDRLINLVGEIVIAQSMLEDAARNANTGGGIDNKLGDALSQLVRGTRDLQEQVMGIRMIPLASTFGRFPRLVRDLAVACGKNVRLETTGEDTELDKHVVELIGDPMVHLIRNSLDHGIESPEDRRSAGKPPEGTLTISAETRGGSVVIEVRDDGRGINLERVRRKAEREGLVDPSAVMSDDEILGLLFRPAFSTADHVTDISGRGVGLDVVKRNVEALNGSVSVSSQLGVGTTFRIRLPLTLAILDGLSFRVGSNVFITSLLSVVRSMRPAEGVLRHILNEGEVLALDGATLPLVRLHQLFDIPDAIEDPTQGIVVVAEHEGGRIALLVDEVLGQQQVVVKRLEEHWSRVEAVMGATILGDGRVALILDTQALARCGRTEPAAAMSAA
jgi:two-component system chemotaxis sensor kinase CheA